MMRNNRRNFIKTISLGSGAAMIPGVLEATNWPVTEINKNNKIKLSELKNPLAIAMWDYSWILRHHRYGEFEDWDKILDKLVTRGYDAIRIDCMPQYVVANKDGKIESTFRSIKKNWKPALWGNDYTMSFNPRQALLEFLPKCKKRGIKVGLSSWFIRHGTERKDIFMEEGGLLRAWDETLKFLQDNNLLDNVIYVDLLNEYPNWHGFDWFKNEMNKRSDAKQFKLDNPEANVPDLDAGDITSPPLKQQFYNDFINTTITSLKRKYPNLDFFASLDSGMSLDHIDLSNFDALDYHIWFAHTGKISGLNEIRSKDQSLDFKKINTDLIDYWNEHKNSFVYPFNVH